jgi:L-fuculose-phosphate aldolase
VPLTLPDAGAYRVFADFVVDGDKHTLATDLFVPGDLEGQLHLKEVPVVATGPLQVELIASALQSHLVVLLRGHGAYARGQTLWEALHWITALEESAQIACIRRGL